MRDNDIIREYTPANMRTEGLYLPDRRNVPLAALPDHELALGLCYKSGGSLAVCAECPGPCAFGRILLQRQREREAKPCDTPTKTGS